MHQSKGSSPKLFYFACEDVSHCVASAEILWLLYCSLYELANRIEVYISYGYSAEECET
jgi:hypothetical protein